MFTLEIAFHCSEYIFIIGIAPIEIFLICCQNHDENYVWHLMLNYSSSYLHMLKSTHLKHLNPLYWRHNDNDGVSNHQPHVCLRNRLFRRRSKKTSKLRVTGICVGTGEFPAQRASYAENVSIWWRHHAFEFCVVILDSICVYIERHFVLSLQIEYLLHRKTSHDFSFISVKFQYCLKSVFTIFIDNQMMK